MNNHRKQALVRCKLLPQMGSARKRWLRTLNYREIRYWVYQKRVPWPTAAWFSESMRASALSSIEKGIWPVERLPEYGNGYFLRSRRNRLWMESVMRDAQNSKNVVPLRGNEVVS